MGDMGWTYGKTAGRYGVDLGGDLGDMGWT